MKGFSLPAKGVLIAFVMLLVVTLIGCAGGTAVPAPTQPPQVVKETVVVPQTQVVQQTVVVPATAAPTAKKPIVVGYSPPTLEMTDFYKFGEMGLRNKAQELGVNVVVVTKAPSSHQAADDQLRIVEDFITLGVDYIWIVPISAEAAPPMIKAANQANVPIIISHSLEPFKDLNVLAYVGTDFTETGTMVGKWIGDHLKGTGVVAMLQGDPGFYNDARVNTAIKVLTESYPGITVYKGDYTAWDTQKGLNSTSTLLKAHPDIKFIYCPSATLTLGAVEAIDKAGLTGKVEVMDYDLIPATIKLMKEGKVVAGMGLRPYVYGENVAQVIKDRLDGKTVQQVWNTHGQISTAADVDQLYPAWYISYGQ